MGLRYSLVRCVGYLFDSHKVRSQSKYLFTHGGYLCHRELWSKLLQKHLQIIIKLFQPWNMSRMFVVKEYDISYLKYYANLL